MTNEEFQRLVLEKLESLESEQKEIHKKIDSITEQTFDLTEFKYEVKEELAEIISNLSRIEIATADNWGDIARLKSIR